MPALPYARLASERIAAAPPAGAGCCDAPAPDRAELIRSDEDLIVRLGRMPVDLAAPLLRADLPGLTPSALLALINVTGEAHHRVIAARPSLDGRVIKAILRGYHDGPVAALACNPTLVFDAEDVQAFARRAQTSPEVEAAVKSHPVLSAPPIEPVRPRAESDVTHSNLKLVVLLRAGKTAEFVAELAKRLNRPPARLSAALVSDSAVPLALTLRAAGLDRTVFLHLLPFWQAAHGGEPWLSERARPIVLSLFTLPPTEARRKLDILLNR